jgi:hypothetical protein
VNGETPRGLVPPKPNLGPEPWSEPEVMPWLALALGLAALAVVLFAWRRRRGARRARGTVAATGGPATDPTPRDRLVGLSVTIRDALTAQFGHSCRAKTTEELSLDERLEPLLGADGFRDLIQFLDRIDRLKFAPDRPGENGADLDEAFRTWGPRMTDLAARIRVKPRSRLRPGNGRTQPNAQAGTTGHGTTRSKRG